MSEKTVTGILGIALLVLCSLGGFFFGQANYPAAVRNLEFRLALAEKNCLRAIEDARNAELYLKEANRIINQRDSIIQALNLKIDELTGKCDSLLDDLFGMAWEHATPFENGWPETEGATL